jgi:CBS domain-containing protein
MTWTVSDVMTKNVDTGDEPKAAGAVTTTGDTALAVAASLMFQHHATALPVVDSHNRLVGTVTRSQVLKAFLRSDRSIRREILKIVAAASVLRDVGPREEGARRFGPAAAGRGRVEVEVVSGLVQLHGEINSRVKAERLIRLIRSVPGVVGVESHLSAPAAGKPA